MDEFVENKKKVNSTFIDDAVKLFAKDFCEQEFIPLEGGVTLEQLEKDPEVFKDRNFTKEEIEGFIKAEAERVGQGDYDYCNFENCDLEASCPLLKNPEKLWQSIGEVFHEYKTANTDTLLVMLKDKCPKLDIAWEAGEALMVNGARTNIRHDQVKSAYQGLRCLVSFKQADNIISTIIANKIKKLF